MRLIYLALLAFTGCLPVGCAENIATDKIGSAFEKAVPVFLEKMNLQTSSIDADGEIVDPEYTVDAVWQTGPRVTMRMRGVRLRLGLAGQGSGPDKPLTPETVAWLRENNPSLLQWLIERGIELATEPPAPEVQP